MSIEKSLYAAPEGMEELDNTEPALEIEIEDPESIEIGIDGEPILKIEKSEDDEEDFGANLAEEMSEGALTELVGDLVGDYEDDVNSRKDWMQTYVDGLEVCALKIVWSLGPVLVVCITRC